MRKFAVEFVGWVGSLWPLLAFYSTVGLIVTIGFLNHPAYPAPLSAQPASSDFVNHCQYRAKDLDGLHEELCKRRSI